MPFDPSAQKTIAVFDFDHTLIETDSFLPFLSFVAGWPKTGTALAHGLALTAVRHWKDRTKTSADARDFLKDHLLQKTLTGHPADRLVPAAERLRSHVKWKEPVRKALLDHHAQGHHIVIASGGLDLYLPELLKDVPYHGLICTEIGIFDNAITGQMTVGNCVRDRKAELVAAYMEKHGPFHESWGYGNLPHDLAMLNLMKHRIVV